MPADKQQPIVIKKVKKHGHGHHGGAWKVAYADFVTAMMAFFLLMWLLGSTTEAQREGISDYFQDPAGIQGPGGASTSMIKFGGAMEMPRGERGKPEDAEMDAKDIEELVQDKERLDELMERLKERIEESPALQQFKEQLLLDITSEGLRIQIVDKENRPMFDLGSARLKSYTEDILHEIAGVINKVPNHVSVSGHTDATPYRADRADYTNWELSADRANAARRELVTGGMRTGKFGRVVGLADSILFDKTDPFNPVNRRISIIVLNKATERAIGLDEQAAAKAAAEAGPSPEELTGEAEMPVPEVVNEIDAEELPAPESPVPEFQNFIEDEPESSAPGPDSGSVPPDFAEPAPSPDAEPEDPMESTIERLLGPPPGQD